MDIQLYEMLRKITESHSHDKCMECSAVPTVEVLWAEGHGHCWFCDKHFKEWSTTGDGKGDICSVKKIIDGKASKNFKDNPSPNIDAGHDGKLKEITFPKMSQDAIDGLNRSLGREK